MLKKLINIFSLRKAFMKGYKGDSKKWRIFFYVGIAIRIISFLTSKAQPKAMDQYDLEPGEYKLVVSDKKDE